MLKLRTLTTMVMTLMLSTNAIGQLKDGETIVFLGDSITQQGAEPTGYVTLFRTALERTRPNSGIQVIGAGISGNRVPNLESRLDRDVLAHKPHVVVIYIGINDVWHSTRGQGTPADQYEAGLRNLVSRCQSAGARVLLATPSVIGEKLGGSNPLDSMLDDYASVTRRVAMETGAVLVDLRESFVDHLAEFNVADAEKGILTTDGVHLNDSGNRFVAAKMLAAAGEAGTGDRVLRHVVLFRFRPDVTEEQRAEIDRAFGNLKQLIPEVKSFERGTNNSPENLNQGFTHGYLVTFDSEEDRAVYLPHPEHKKFVELLGGKLEEAFVFDYWAVK